MGGKSIGLESIEDFEASLLPDAEGDGASEPSGESGGAGGVGGGETIGLAETNDPDAPVSEVGRRRSAARQPAPAEDEGASLIGKRLGQYRILRQLGAGTMGVVFEVEDVTLHRVAALKVLRRQVGSSADMTRRVDRFLLEARAAARIDHPSIAHIYGIGEHDGWWAIAMEYLEAGSLKALCDASGVVEPARAGRLIADVARGLAAAHEVGVIHRDIKPGNLMLTRHGHCKIVDFGLVKLESADNPFRDDQKVVGSPYFIAPEVARREGAGPAADIYSLGATFYSLLCGRPPFMGGDTEELLRMHQEETAPPISERSPSCPPALVELVESMLAKDPADRPSADTVALVLEHELAAETGSRILDLGSGSRTGDGSSSRVMDGGVAGAPAGSGAGAGSLRRPTVAWPGRLFAVLATALVITAVAGVAWVISGGGTGGIAPAVEDSAPELAVIQDDPVTNGIGMRLVHLPAGTFRMGSPASESGRHGDERLFDVTLSQDVYMSATEVTQAEWVAVMGSEYEPPEGVHPNESDGLRFLGASLPAYVSWYEASEFCLLLSEREGKRYRLPTEAEWEYACRAGGVRAFGVRESISPARANVDAPVGSSVSAPAVRPLPVASFPPNRWGLYDMHGNVMEWCEDWFGAYPIGSATDPAGAETGEVRVVRGGSWDAYARVARSANRWGTFPTVRTDTIGFRVVLDPSAPPDLGRGSYLASRPESWGRSASSARDVPSALRVPVDEGLASYAPGVAVTGRIRSVGSDTMDRVMASWESAFRRWHPEVSFRHSGRGSGTAVPSLAEGLSHVGPMSRPLTSTERRSFLAEHGYEPTQVEIARDAMAVYVHPQNPLASAGLGLERLRGMFGGDEPVRRWAQLGMEDGLTAREIRAYGRNPASGTHGLFRSQVLGGAPFGGWVTELIGSAEVIDAVSGDPDGIGYSSVSYARAGVSFVPLGREGSGDAVLPNASSVVSGAYPLVRPLYLSLSVSPEGGLTAVQREFMRFVFSREGQEIVARCGFFPVSAARAAAELERLGIDASGAG